MAIAACRHLYCYRIAAAVTVSAMTVITIVVVVAAATRRWMDPCLYRLSAPCTASAASVGTGFGRTCGPSGDSKL